jgi:hypothetical protein
LDQQQRSAATSDRVSASNRTASREGRSSGVSERRTGLARTGNG